MWRCLFYINLVTGYVALQIRRRKRFNQPFPRESFIKAVLDKDVSFTISEMNTLLAEVGFSELDIYDGRQGKKGGVSDVKRPYKVLENKVKTMISAEYCYGDQYNSLCTT